MFIGIDLGTSALKVVIIDADSQIRAQAEQPLALSQPQAGWFEQAPEAWWQALDAAMLQLRQQAPTTLAQVTAIGLSGQMHGTVLLDADGQVIRPAILWNDGRSVDQCAQLEAAVAQAGADSRALTGNIAMAGFSAPKLLWLRQHEPAHFARLHMCLLPKDYLRWRLCGEFVSDMSDAAGTLWLEVAARRWSAPMISACGMSVAQLPRLIEGDAVSGYLQPNWAERWGLSLVQPLPIAGGAGDNAASAVGLGITTAGEGFISLGTSGVVFCVTDQSHSNHARAVHNFCHALPNRWHQMSVMLACTASLNWAATILGFSHAAQLVAAASTLDVGAQAQAPLFLPYLQGERSPHNNPLARAAWLQLNSRHTRADMAYAVLEGVCFGLRDGFFSVHNWQAIRELWVVGGGSQSAYWLQLLADCLQIELRQGVDSAHGAALGAARLGALAWASANPGAGLHQAQILQKPLLQASYSPDALRGASLTQRYQRFVAQYAAA